MRRQNLLRKFTGGVCSTWETNDQIYQGRGGGRGGGGGGGGVGGGGVHKYIFQQSENCKSENNFLQPW